MDHHRLQWMNMLLYLTSKMQTMSKFGNIHSALRFLFCTRTTPDEYRATPGFPFWNSIFSHNKFSPKNKSNFISPAPNELGWTQVLLRIWKHYNSELLMTVMQICGKAKIVPSSDHRRSVFTNVNLIVTSRNTSVRNIHSNVKGDIILSDDWM